MHRAGNRKPWCKAKSLGKRVLVALLAFELSFGTIPLTAFADDSLDPSGTQLELVGSNDANQGEDESDLGLGTTGSENDAEAGVSESQDSESTPVEVDDATVSDMQDAGENQDEDNLAEETDAVEDSVSDDAAIELGAEEAADYEGSSEEESVPVESSEGTDLQDSMNPDEAVDALAEEMVEELGSNSTEEEDPAESSEEASDEEKAAAADSESTDDAVSEQENDDQDALESQVGTLLYPGSNNVRWAIKKGETTTFQFYASSSMFSDLDIFGSSVVSVGEIPA